MSNKSLHCFAGTWTGCMWGWLPSWWGWVGSLDPACLSSRGVIRSILILPSPGRQCGRSALQPHPGGGWTWWWCGLKRHTNIKICTIYSRTDNCFSCGSQVICTNQITFFFVKIKWFRLPCQYESFHNCHFRCRTSYRKTSNTNTYEMWRLSVILQMQLQCLKNLKTKYLWIYFRLIMC